MDKAKRNVFIAAWLAFIVWPSFWLFVQEHWKTRFVGPIYIFSLMTLPMIVFPAVGLYRNTKPGKRWPVVVAIAAVVALDLALIPVLAAMGIRGHHAP